MKIQSLCEEIGGYGCLAFCYAAVVESLNAEWKQASEGVKAMKLLADVVDARFAGLLGDECYVNSAGRYMEYLDPKHKYKVEKVELDGTLDAVLGKVCPVRFDYMGKSHWALMAGDTIVFDSLNDSRCRRYGKPMSARVITIEER